MDADWVAAISAAATTLITLGAVAVALFQLNTAREEQRQVNRPVMVAQYERPAGPGQPLEVSVRNIGRTVARDVRISFDPPLPAAAPAPAGGGGPGAAAPGPVELVRRTLMDTTFETWAPGQKVTVPLWAPHPDGPAAPYSAEGVPRRQRIRFSYRGHDGRRHEESLELNSWIWSGAMVSDDELTRIRGELRGIREELRRIGRAG